MKSKQRNNRILIVGKVPPPAGGVGVHVSRLLTELETRGFDVEFFDLRNRRLWALPSRIFACRILHLHVSSSYARIIGVILARLTRTKVIATFHGALGRFGALRNYVDKLAIAMADFSIVLNEQSHLMARKISSCAVAASAYIPADKSVPLSVPLASQLASWKEEFTLVFCSNANSMLMDKYGNEVYGILNLVRIFEKHEQWGLIFSDTSGDYASYFAEKQIRIPRNIFIVKEVHDFLNIIEASHCLVRATSTDGDSLSIREALDMERNVIASNCVSRPDGCIVYDQADEGALEACIANYQPHRVEHSVVNGATAVVDLYARLGVFSSKDSGALPDRSAPTTTSSSHAE